MQRTFISTLALLLTAHIGCSLSMHKPQSIEGEITLMMGPQVFSPNRGWAAQNLTPISLVDLELSVDDKIWRTGRGEGIIYNSTSHTVTQVALPAEVINLLYDSERQRLFAVTSPLPIRRETDPPDEPVLRFPAEGSQIRYFDADIEESIELPIPDGMRIADLALSPDGQRLLASNSRQIICVHMDTLDWDIISVDANPIRGFAPEFISNDVWAMVSEERRGLEFWRFGDSEPLDTLPWAQSIIPSPSGTFAFAVAEQGSSFAGEIVQISHTPFSIEKTGTRIENRPGLSPHLAAWSPDGLVIAFAGATLSVSKRVTTHIYLFDVTESRMQRVFRRHNLTDPTDNLGLMGISWCTSP